MNVFNQDPTQNPTPAPQGEDQIATKLAGILNEKGEPKYADVITAIDALKASQDFIPTLQSQVSTKDAEIAQLREQLAKASGVEEVLQRFAQQQQPVATPQAQPEPPVATPPAQFGQEDITSLVHNLFQQRDEANKAAQNFAQVQNSLVAAHGANATAHIAKVAKELNTTPDALEQMAKTNPTMALQLLGTSTPKLGMTYGGTNTSGIQPSVADKLQAPTSSLLFGAKTSDVKDFMAKVKAEVYREHGIES